MALNESARPVLLALRRIGPYHHARFQAAAGRLPLEVLQTRPDSNEYPWIFEPSGRLYRSHRLTGAAHPEADPPRAQIDRQLDALLDRLHPAALVCVGWADRAYHRLFRQAHRRRLPLVLISDSRRRDQPRRALTEFPKRLLLRQCSAALVAGSESRSYLEGLGFPPGAIFQPWDVVDNALFAAAAAPEAAAGAAWSRAPHFLCVSRFVAKKNHRGLLRAYAAYQRQGGAWGLRLIGAGPLEGEIRAAVAALPDPARVHLDPFLQLDGLAAAYRRAAAFVLASSSDQWGLVVNEAIAAGLPVLVSSACGCAVDLVRHGRTGWCFDPGDPQDLLAALRRAEAQPPAERAAMLAAARERLRGWDLEAFAAGLEQAVQHAIAFPRRSVGARLTAAILARR